MRCQFAPKRLIIALIDIIRCLSFICQTLHHVLTFSVYIEMGPRGCFENGCQVVAFISLTRPHKVIAGRTTNL